jgi:putative transposase
VSERRACQIVGQHRSTQRHDPVVAGDDQALRGELRAISRRRPRWGYRQFDQTQDGRLIKPLHVVDEFTREALAIECRRRIDADEVVTVLDRLVADRGSAPTFLRCDNGPEMTANALRDWCCFSRTGSAYIEPGPPWQNPFVESFGGRVRDGLLSVEMFSCLTEAQVLIEDWREDYNHHPPHSALGMMTPARFAVGSREAHRAAARASAELQSAYGLAPSNAGAEPGLQTPTTHQLSQQVDR